MTTFTPSESIASSMRRVAELALVSSSRVMYRIGRPMTLLPHSSMASFMPRSSSGPTSEKAPVNGQMPSITISLPWAVVRAGAPSRLVPAATEVVARNSRRVMDFIGSTSVWIGGRRCPMNGNGYRGGQASTRPGRPASRGRVCRFP